VDHSLFFWTRGTAKDGEREREGGEREGEDEEGKSRSRERRRETQERRDGRDWEERLEREAHALVASVRRRSQRKMI